MQRDKDIASANTIPEAFVAYASKAFCTLAMCRLIHEEFLGLDVCSGGELYTAIEAGIPPENILFHGNCKTLSEIEMGVRVGVGRFIVDNLDELDLLSEISRKVEEKNACSDSSQSRGGSTYTSLYTDRPHRFKVWTWNN